VDMQDRFGVRDRAELAEGGRHAVIKGLEKARG